MQRVRNPLSVLPPRHTTAVDPDISAEQLLVYINDNACVEMPVDLDMPPPANLVPPVGLEASDHMRFKQYMDTLRDKKYQCPSWRRLNYFVIYGRTTGGRSAVISVPCPLSFCAELPETLNGVSPITDEEVRVMMETVQRNLLNKLDAEADEFEGKFGYAMRTKPTVTFDWEFSWRERSSGWQPKDLDSFVAFYNATDDHLDGEGDAKPPPNLEVKKVPIVRFTVQNKWAERQVISILEEKTFLPCLPPGSDPVPVQIWETSRQVKPELRFRLENGIPAAGWARIRNHRTVQWTLSHMDYECVIENVANDIQVLPDKLTPAPLAMVCIDIECVSGSISEYKRMLETGRNRFPRVWDSATHSLTNNHITVIGMVFRMADGREIIIALQFDDSKAGQSNDVAYSLQHFETQGRSFDYYRFMYRSEQELVCAMRDVIVFYDPDGLMTFNGDGFDWPFIMGRIGDQSASVYSRIYAMGRLIWTEWKTQFVQCTTTPGGQKIPVFGNNSKKRDQDSNIAGHSMPVWELGRYSQSTMTPELSGRFDCDLMVLVMGLGKSHKRFTFVRNKLNDYAERFLKDFKKMEIDLFGNWFGISKFNPQDSLEEQRLTLVNYCVVDCALPLRIFASENLATYLTLVSTVTRARMHDVINRGQLARTGALYAAEAWSRGWVLTYSLLPGFRYEGAIVLTPTPMTMAGVDDDDPGELLPDQELAEGLDWKYFVREVETGEVISPNLPNVLYKFDKPDLSTYDGEGHVQTRMRIVDENDTSKVISEHAVWVPAQFKNGNVIATLDFQSLYPSVIQAHNMCASTECNLAEPLNPAEVYAVKQRIRHRVAVIEQITDYQQATLRRNELLEQEKAAHARRTFNFTDTKSPEIITGRKRKRDADDGLGDDESGDDGGISSRNNDDGFEPSATDCYVMGDGDRSRDMMDREFMSTIQVSADDDPTRRRKRVHRFVTPDVREGILPVICRRCLGERARHKAMLKGMQKDRNGLAEILEDDLKQQQADLRNPQLQPLLQSNNESVELTELQLKEKWSVKRRILLDIARSEPDLQDKTELLRRILGHALFYELELRMQQSDTLQLVFKIIANSIYGSAGNKQPMSFLASPATAESVTARARQAIVSCRDTVLDVFKKMPEYAGEIMDVVYGDTDSIFVWLRTKTTERAWDIAKAICGYINKTVFGYLKNNTFNLQYEALKFGFTIMKRKMYIAQQLEHGKTYTELLQKGVATVRRDKPQALTDLLSAIFEAVTRLCNVKKSVMRLFILRIVFNYLEKMIANQLPIEKYWITQRIMTMPKPGHKPVQHVAVALKMQETDGVPVRVGDSVTYVIAQGEQAMSSIDAKLTDIDRHFYFSNRISGVLATAMTPIIGAERVDLISTVYENAFKHITSIDQSFSKMTPTEFRWNQLASLAGAGSRVYYAPKTLAAQKRKQNDQLKKDAKRQQTSMASFFAAIQQKKQ